MNVFTYINNGRLFVSVNDYYQGDINIYENCLTRFFSKLFGKSENILIGGKNYRINKKSYLKLLNNISSNSKTIASDFDLWIKDKVIKKDKRMKDAISPKVKLENSKLLAKSIISGDEQLVHDLLRKGADPDVVFRVFDANDLHGFSHIERDSRRELLINGSKTIALTPINTFFGLHECNCNESIRYKYMKGTPLFFAIQLKKDKIIQLLLNFDAHNSKGKQNEIKLFCKRIPSYERNYRSVAIPMITVKTLKKFNFSNG